MIFLISCSISIADTIIDLDDETNIVDLGHLKYSDTIEKALTVKINNCTDEIKLVYLFSEVNNSALSIESSWYSPINNQTTIIFKTNKIIPEWYFKNNTRQFVYMDNNSKTLFRVYVDYSGIILPENPLDSLIDDNSELSENLTEIWENYNQTYTKLNITTNKLIEKWDSLNSTSKEIDKLKDEINELETNNKNLDIGLKEQINETNKYKGWYNTKKSEYDDLKTQAIRMNDALGKWPWIFGTVVFLVAFFIFLWDRRKKIFKNKPVEMQDAHKNFGYTKEAGILDKLKFWNKSDQNTNIKNNVNSQENIQQFDAVSEKDYFDDKIKDLHARVDNLEEKYTLDFQTLTKRVDKIISPKKINKTT